MFDRPKRRDFITLFGSAAAASAFWPLAVRAQQAEPLRRAGVLTGYAERDPEGQARLTAMQEALANLGWTVGRNLKIDYRWAPGDADHRRKYGAELVALSPDVIVAQGGLSLGPLLQLTRTISIVFVSVTDPVGGGVVASLARPGGNATGFSSIEYGVSVKWLDY